jgi:hypothetical protein
MRGYDDRLIEAITSGLNRSVADMDACTRSRLHRARNRALEAPASRAPRWLIGSAFATASIAALAFNLWISQPVSDTVPAAEDIELLTDAEGVEFYEQLEFVQWLEESGQSG